MTWTKPIELLITDDHQIITDGILMILQGEPSIGTIHTAGNGIEAVDIATRFPVDCVILDINMPGLNGLEAAKRIKYIKPAIRIIILSMICDPSFIGKMRSAGASGFLSKDTGKTELLVAIHAVMNDDLYVGDTLGNKPSRRPGEYYNLETAPGPDLTKREQEILRLIADGMTNGEIAVKLFLSPKTVDTHRKNMIAKLELKNTAALIKYGADHGLL